MTKIDDIDVQILQALAKDARLSVEKIAEQVNLSPTPVRRRLKRLEAEGVIRGYTIDVNMEQCGFGLMLYIFIKLQSRDRVTIADFESRVQQLSEITICHLVTGAHDYVLKAHMPDMETYNAFLRRRLSELPGVFGLETSLLIGRVKEMSPTPYRRGR